MPSAKHGPNRLDSYQAIHETWMQRFLRERFVTSDDTEFLPGGDTIILKGRISCLGNLYIDVLKVLEILGGEGVDALVQTVYYSYNVTLRNVGNVLRYNSPHVRPGEQDSIAHHNYHHKHVFDVLQGDREGVAEIIYDENLVPTLGEVIEEIREWYYSHLYEVENP